MSKADKLINGLKQKPKDFTYEEAKKLLESLEFFENNKGKTSGSRVEFKNYKLNEKIELHKPHPDNILKMYVVKNLLNRLYEIGVI